MNEKQKIPLIEIILAILVIGGLIFLLVKSLISAKATEKQPEIEPTDTGTENNRKATVIPVVSEPISVQSVPEIQFSPILTDVIPFTRDETQFPARRKRKRITRENMATIFRHGSQKLNLTNAVIELKTLGFGHSAAYEALKPNGQFSAWLQFAPDGIITWMGR
jgi:hypothetical protein